MDLISRIKKSEALKLLSSRDKKGLIKRVKAEDQKLIEIVQNLLDEEDKKIESASIAAKELAEKLGSRLVNKQKKKIIKKKEKQSKQEDLKEMEKLLKELN